jgi:hypothetical protein
MFHVPETGHVVPSRDQGDGRKRRSSPRPPLQIKTITSLHFSPKMRPPKADTAPYFAAILPFLPLPFEEVCLASAPRVQTGFRGFGIGQFAVCSQSVSKEVLFANQGPSFFPANYSLKFFIVQPRNAGNTLTPMICRTYFLFGQFACSRPPTPQCPSALMKRFMSRKRPFQYLKTSNL